MCSLVGLLAGLRKKAFSGCFGSGLIQTSEGELCGPGVI